jgi:hypothetical protein
VSGEYHAASVIGKSAVDMSKLASSAQGLPGRLGIALIGAIEAQAPAIIGGFRVRVRGWFPSSEPVPCVVNRGSVAVVCMPRRYPY